MNKSKYCKQQRYTIEQYREFCKAMDSLADGLVWMLEHHPLKDTGVWIEQDRLIPSNMPDDLKSILIQELKKRGVEFNMDEGTYRY